MSNSNSETGPGTGPTVKQNSAKKKDADRRDWSARLKALTPLITVIITGAALMFQMVRSSQDDKQADYAAWRDVLKSIKIDDPGSVEMGLYSLQAYFDPPSQHTTEARSIAAALLPRTASEAGFDSVFWKLDKDASSANQNELISVGKRLKHLEEDAMSHALDERQIAAGDCPQKFPELFAERSSCFTNDRGFTEASLGRVWLYSWEIGTVGDGLSALWRNGSRQVKPIDAKDLSGLVFDNVNLTGLNFASVDLSGTMIHYSILDGANFDSKTKLDYADLTDMQSFKGSTWTDAPWWKAETVSCGLWEYLDKTYPPPSNAKAEADALGKSCKNSTATRP